MNGNQTEVKVNPSGLKYQNYSRSTAVTPILNYFWAASLTCGLCAIFLHDYTTLFVIIWVIISIAILVTFLVLAFMHPTRLMSEEYNLATQQIGVGDKGTGLQDVSDLKLMTPISNTTDKIEKV